MAYYIGPAIGIPSHPEEGHLTLPRSQSNQRPPRAALTDERGPGGFLPPRRRAGKARRAGVRLSPTPAGVLACHPNAGQCVAPGDLRSSAAAR